MKSNKSKNTKNISTNTNKKSQKEYSQEINEQSRKTTKSITTFEKMSFIEKAKYNLQYFPFKRGCHYFYDLTKFKRINNTTYVENNQQYGTFHDSALQKQYKTKDLINRKYLGLPVLQQISKMKDKNVCHQYLFKNEDKKWRLDQFLYQLKYIKNHIEILERNQANRFSFIKKDVELSLLYDSQIQTQEKLDLLKKKIVSLQHRKQKQQEQFFEQDELFYHSSLNQLYFNKKKQQQVTINFQSIIMQAVCMSQLNELIYTNIEENSTQYNKLMVLFSVFTTTDKQCPLFIKQFEKYMAQGKDLGQIIPLFIFHFPKKQNVNWIAQVLLLRVYQVHGQSAFYTLKNIWKNIFGQDITFKQQYSQIQCDQYVEIIKGICQKYKSKKISNSNKSISLPTVTNYHFYFQQKPKIKRLCSKDYVFLYYVYYLYERVSSINLDYKLVGSQYFTKYNHQLFQKIGDLSIASFDYVINKCCDLMVQNVVQTQISVDIFSEYIQSSNMVMVWIQNKTSSKQESIEQLQNSSEKLENNNQQNQNHLDCDSSQSRTLRKRRRLL